MVKVKNIELLKNAEVLEEINRHRWIESEKAGTDLSFETAAKDWLERFSDGWIAYHKPAATSLPKRGAKKVANK